MAAFSIQLRARLRGALGVPSETRQYYIPDVKDEDEARARAIARADSEGLDHPLIETVLEDRTS